jgi:hypothetical protein
MTIDLDPCCQTTAGFVLASFKILFCDLSSTSFESAPLEGESDATFRPDLPRLENRHTTPLSGSLGLPTSEWWFLFTFCSEKWD